MGTAEKEEQLYTFGVEDLLLTKEQKSKVIEIYYDFY